MDNSLVFWDVDFQQAPFGSDGILVGYVFVLLPARLP